MYAISTPNTSLLCKFMSFLHTESMKVIVKTSIIRKSKSNPIRNNFEKESHLSLNIIGVPLAAIYEGKLNNRYNGVLSYMYFLGSVLTYSI